MKIAARAAGEAKACMRAMPRSMSRSLNCSEMGPRLRRRHLVKSRCCQIRRHYMPGPVLYTRVAL
jgi:hypothetical protein